MVELDPTILLHERSFTLLTRYSQNMSLCLPDMVTLLHAGSAVTGDVLTRLYMSTEHVFGI